MSPFGLLSEENEQIQISQKNDGQEWQLDTEGRPEVELSIHKFTIWERSLWASL